MKKTIIATITFPEKQSDKKIYSIGSTYFIENSEALKLKANYINVCKNLEFFNYANLTILIILDDSIFQLLRTTHKNTKYARSSILERIVKTEKSTIKSYYIEKSKFYSDYGFRTIFDVGSEKRVEKILKKNEDGYTVECDNIQPFDNECDYELIKKIRINRKNVIFIFNNELWIEVLNKFKKHNVIISGGTITKRHIFSPTQLRLAIFILALEKENSFTKVRNSFFSKAKDDVNIEWIDENKALRILNVSPSKPTIDFTTEELNEEIWNKILANLTENNN